jgi:ubiquinone/menaquinone biosynthesis C-methylase UbiE
MPRGIVRFPHRPTQEEPVSDAPAAERPYQVDDAWSRAVFTRRSGSVGAFLAPHLRPGMRLIDCGCGPGSITVDLAAIVAPGAVIEMDRREDALNDGRRLARERGVVNIAFAAANIYRLPYLDGSFHAAFSCAVLQHLADPRAALAEIRRVRMPDGVIGIVDGSSPLTFRYPTNSFLDTWDRLRALQRAHNTGDLLKCSSYAPCCVRPASRAQRRRERSPPKSVAPLARPKRRKAPRGTI